MSRNFDLLQEMEQSRAIPLNESASVALPTASEDLSGSPAAAAQSSLTDRALRIVQNVFLLQTEAPPRLVVFAGVDHRTGCSRIAASVAASLAASGRGSVCLVEANFRSPGLPAMLGTTNHHGLTDALLATGGTAGDAADGNTDGIRSYAKEISDGRFWFLSAGALAPDSPKLLNSDRLKQRLAELRKEFDFVLVDAPPLVRYPDGISLAQLSDGLVLVLEADATRREAAQVSMNNLRSAKVPVLAAVLNKRTYPIPEAIYKRL